MNFDRENNYFLFKRFFDLFLLLFCLPIIITPFLGICLIVYFTSKGPIFYWSDRVGRYNKIFKMPKFRSMYVGSPLTASHLLDNPSQYMTPIGSFLRKSSLDELPQLWSIMKGDMSFVGPRPALFNQYDLIKLRKKAGVDRILPGLTGLAQIKGRDQISMEQKVVLDMQYMNNQSFIHDIIILLSTILKVLKLDNISH